MVEASEFVPYVDAVGYSHEDGAEGGVSYFCMPADCFLKCLVVDTDLNAVCFSVPLCVMYSLNDSGVGVCLW